MLWNRIKSWEEQNVAWNFFGRKRIYSNFWQSELKWSQSFKIKIFIFGWLLRRTRVRGLISWKSFSLYDYCTPEREQILHFIFLKRNFMQRVKKLKKNWFPRYVFIYFTRIISIAFVFAHFFILFFCNKIENYMRATIRKIEYFFLSHKMLQSWT